MLRERSCASSTMIVSYAVRRRSRRISARRMPSVITFTRRQVADGVGEAHALSDRPAERHRELLGDALLPRCALRSAAAGCGRSSRRRRGRARGRSSGFESSSPIRSRQPRRRPGGRGSRPRSSSRRALTGSSSGKVMAGTAAARARPALYGGVDRRAECRDSLRSVGGEPEPRRASWRASLLRSRIVTPSRRAASSSRVVGHVRPKYPAVVAPDRPCRRDTPSVSCATGPGSTW